MKTWAGLSLIEAVLIGCSISALNDQHGARREWMIDKCPPPKGNLLDPAGSMLSGCSGAATITWLHLRGGAPARASRKRESKSFDSEPSRKKSGTLSGRKRADEPSDVPAQDMEPEIPSSDVHMSG